MFANRTEGTGLSNPSPLLLEFNTTGKQKYNRLDSDGWLYNLFRLTVSWESYLKYDTLINGKSECTSMCNMAYFILGKLYLIMSSILKLTCSQYNFKF